MTAPRIEVDLQKIRYNTQSLVQRLGKRGISVTGVTKAVCGHPDIARAMLDGGVAGLADARIENIERMRGSGIICPTSLIRTPMVSQSDRVIADCGISFNTELDTIHRLATAAQRVNRVHGIVLMVEMGDLREGILPGELKQFVTRAMSIPGIAVKGIGTSFACLSGNAPDQQAMSAFSKLVTEIEVACALSLETVSGGNSANLPWAFGDASTGRVNDLRLGEAILLGVDPVSSHAIDGLFTDAFVLVAEVIEAKLKPERNKKSRAEPDPTHFQQSILALGYQDTDIDGLTLPLKHTLIGATSDHLMLGTGDSHLAIGAEIALQPNYSALMRAMNAPNVAKVVRNAKSSDRDHMTRLRAAPC